MIQQRVGLGYDIHRFVQGRDLILGGVNIPYDRGLEGHSDADVVLHALCDALLGALGKGDIGEHFPNTDNAYKNISSILLLEKVQNLCVQEHYKVSNVDIAVQAEEPNLKKHKEQMKINIAGVLGLDISQVNIKATTQEGLGSIGNKEGIAAFASVLIYKE